MRRAASRPLRKPLKQAISQILKYLRAVSSTTLDGTLAPMLKTSTSTGPISRSIRVTRRDHLFFLAGVGAEGDGLAAGGLDLLHQRLQLLGVAAGDAGGVAAGGEAPGDRAAGGVTRADHERHRIHVSVVRWSREIEP